MKYKKIKNVYLIKLFRGEKILDTITKFCEKNKIKMGYFSGIGALGQVELAHYVVENKKYSSKKFEQPLEIVNLNGNVATMDGKVYLHCHVLVSDNKMRPYAGHLVEGKIAATGEIFLTKLEGKINRKYDDFIGLNLFDM